MHRRDGRRRDERSRSTGHDSDWDRETIPLRGVAAVVPLRGILDSSPDADPRGRGDEERTVVIDRAATAEESSIRPPPREPHEQGDLWYVRLRLREDRIARLWVDQQTERDVLVWRDDTESWAPLLTVPQLRNALLVQRAIKDPLPAVPGSLRPGAGEAAPPLGAGAPSSCAPVVVDADEIVIPGAPRVPDLGVAPELEARRAPTGSIALAPRPSPTVSVRPPPPSTRVGVTTAVMPAAEPNHRPARTTVTATMPAMAVSSRRADGASPPRTSSTARTSRTVAAPTPVAHPERLAWMAAVVAVSAFAVVTASIGHRQRNVIAQLSAAAPAGFSTTAANPAVGSGPDPAEPSTVTADAAAARSASGVEPAHLDVSAAAANAPARVPDPTAQPDAQRDPPAASDSAASDDTERSSNAASAAAGARTTRRSAAARVTEPALVAAQSPVAKTPVSGSSNSFDKGAARSAAVSAAQRVRYCAEGPASGTVQITFAPSGLVSNATIVRLKGDGIRSDCVLRSFQAARISPFAGQPVTVQKSFSFSQ